MAKTGMYVGLDIGTTSVKVVVAEYIDSQMNIIGVETQNQKGLTEALSLISIKRSKRYNEQYDKQKKKQVSRSKA